MGQPTATGEERFSKKLENLAKRDLKENFVHQLSDTKKNMGGGGV
jgi:hypothetical protein